jgi:hypothetical protein
LAHTSYRHASLAVVHLTGVYLSFILIEQATRPAWGCCVAWGEVMRCPRMVPDGDDGCNVELGIVVCGGMRLARVPPYTVDVTVRVRPLEEKCELIVHTTSAEELQNCKRSKYPTHG